MHTPLNFLRPTAFLRRLGVQLALVALLAAALMPTISRLAHPEGLSDWASICQSLPGGTSQDGSGPLGDVCAFCSLAHTTPAMLPDLPAAIAVVDFAPPAPLAPVPLRASVAQARAPAARGPPSLV